MLYIILSVIAVAFWLWMVIDALRNPRLGWIERLVWLFEIFCFNILGAAVYFAFGRHHKLTQLGNAALPTDRLHPAVDAPMNSRTIFVVYLSILLYTVAPILCILISSAIAHATGSQLDESGPHPCIILGIDFGDMLCTMFVAGWMALVTIPTGLFAFFVFTIVCLVDQSRPRRE